MPEGIDATGWLVILCALALGFGLVKFMLVVRADPPGGGQPPQPWYAVLEVAEGAPIEAVRGAYEALRARVVEDPTSREGAGFTQAAQGALQRLDAAYARALAQHRAAPEP